MPASGMEREIQRYRQRRPGRIDELQRIAAAMSGGYAVAGNNTGHRCAATSLMMGHPEKIRDFGERAGHEMTIKAKAIVEALLYNDRPRHSYMVERGGGSMAGMKAAQRFPTDYDGLGGGRPGHLPDVSRVRVIWIWQATHPNPASTIPPEKSRRDSQCRALAAVRTGFDGVEDGVLEDPTRCKFDPQSSGVQGCRRPVHCCFDARRRRRRASSVVPQPIRARRRKSSGCCSFPGSERRWVQSAGPAPVSISSDFCEYFGARDPSLDLFEAADQLRQRSTPRRTRRRTP